MIYSSLPDAVQATIQEVEEASEETIQESGKLARQYAISTDLFQVGSIFRQQTQFTTLSRFSGEVESHLPYAQFLEFGNGPGRIYAKNAKCLHFQVGGKDIFVKSVNSHPPLPYMEQAGKRIEGEIEDIFLAKLKE